MPDIGENADIAIKDDDLEWDFLEAWQEDKMLIRFQQR